MGDWKAVMLNLKKNPHATWELYNLKTDRNEKTDVATQYHELIKQFDAILKKEHQPSPIKEWEFIDNKLPADK